MQHAVLATFLIVEHELQCDAGLIGPVGVGRVTTVANQVARIIHGVISPQLEWFDSGEGQTR